MEQWPLQLLYALEELHALEDGAMATEKCQPSPRFVLYLFSSLTSASLHFYFQFVILVILSNSCHAP